VKILCKLSTETKHYSSHTILQNFNLPTKQRSLLSTAIHCRRRSNALLSSAPLVQRPNAQATRCLVPDDWRWWRSDTLPTPLVRHDPQSWKLVDRRPHIHSHLLA